VHLLLQHKRIPSPFDRNAKTNDKLYCTQMSYFVWFIAIHVLVKADRQNSCKVLNRTYLTS